MQRCARLVARVTRARAGNYRISYAITAAQFFSCFLINSQVNFVVGPSAKHESVADLDPEAAVAAATATDAANPPLSPGNNTSSVRELGSPTSATPLTADAHLTLPSPQAAGAGPAQPHWLSLLKTPSYLLLCLTLFTCGAARRLGCLSG